MLILKRCRLIRVPKTGSTYCTAAIQRSCRNCWDIRDTDKHPHLAASEGPQMPAFGFVRHPITWLESYWRHRCTHGWHPGLQIDQRCQSSEFPAFVENVLAKMDLGFVGREFETKLGDDYQDCGFVGRFERLTADLVAGLAFFGEDFNLSKLLDTEPENVGDRTRFPNPILPLELSTRIVRSESRLMRRYYADCPILRSALKLS